MTWIESLESIYKMALGAGLAFFFCYYVWEVESAGDGGRLAMLIWLICSFLSRHLRNKIAATDC